MMYSIEPKDRTYVKGYGFLPFAKNMGTQLSSKYDQKLLDSAKKINSRSNKKLPQKEQSKKQQRQLVI